MENRLALVLLPFLDNQQKFRKAISMRHHVKPIPRIYPSSARKQRPKVAYPLTHEQNLMKEQEKSRF